VKVWQKVWQEHKFHFKTTLPGSLNDGMYILNVEKIDNRNENVKMTIF